MSDLLLTEAGAIDCTEMGAPNGPAVVFLHHGFGTRLSLVNLAERLERHLPEHRLVLYSRPGCGRSPPMSPAKPIDYLTREATIVLPAVMDALGLGSADLIGHSDGGSIALIAAAMHPDRVRSITALAPHVIVEARTRQGIRALPKPGSNHDFERALAQRHADIGVAYNAWRALWLSQDMAEWDITPLLPSIFCPVQLVQGGGDEYGTFRQIDLIETKVSSPSISALRIADAGHELHKSHPEVVLAACLDAISERSQSSAGLRG
ncbi:pimeloyl-ACP methyl ester carboxylesterase [Roseovarius sp. MBR-78]|uniref:alpha/beta fold hydrolase n=1 Tax=Roseovarius sp. MBR-78 TaxID=3156460 RepID=UPI003394DEAF